MPEPERLKPGESRVVEDGDRKIYVAACAKCGRQVTGHQPDKVRCRCGADVDLRG